MDTRISTDSAKAGSYILFAAKVNLTIDLKRHFLLLFSSFILGIPNRD